MILTFVDAPIYHIPYFMPFNKSYLIIYYQYLSYVTIVIAIAYYYLIYYIIYHFLSLL